MDRDPKDFICAVKDNFEDMKASIKQAGGDPLAMKAEIDLFLSYTNYILDAFLEWYTGGEKR